MSDPEEFAIEVIQNLLHVDMNIRKKGFSQVQAHWDIKFREYLWKAIEQEKNKNFQAELVHFALNKLQSGSLRKMIRFLEQDVLFSKSISYILSDYFEYESPEIRDALLKSLRREGSSYKFVIGLIQGPLNYLSSNEMKDFIIDVIHPEIIDKYRIELIITIFNKYFSDRAFHQLIGEDLWEYIKNDTYLHYVILENYFSNKPSITPSKVKVRKRPELLWNNWSWVITSQGKSRNPTQILSYHNEFSDLLEESDLFILETLQSKNPKIQLSLTKILSELAVSQSPPGVTTIYLEKLYHVWDLLEKHEMQSRLLEIDQLDNTTLDHEFPKEQFDEEFEEPSFSSYLSSLNINPHDLVARIICFIPRTHLLKLVTNENEEVGINAIKSLLNKQFHQLPAPEYLVGSPLQWFNFFKNVIHQFSVDHSTEYFGEITHLVFLLIDLILDTPQSSFTTKFFEEININKKLITSLKSLPFGFPLYFRFQSLLDEPPEILPVDAPMTPKQEILLFTTLFKSVQEPQILKSLQNIILMDTYEVQHEIIDFLNEQVFINPEIDMTKVGRNIYQLTRSLSKSSDVRIRTKGVLLQTQLKDFAVS